MQPFWLLFVPFRSCFPFLTSVFSLSFVFHPFSHFPLFLFPLFIFCSPMWNRLISPLGRGEISRFPRNYTPENFRSCDSIVIFNSSTCCSKGVLEVNLDLTTSAAVSSLMSGLLSGKWSVSAALRLCTTASQTPTWQIKQKIVSV